MHLWLYKTTIRKAKLVRWLCQAMTYIPATRHPQILIGYINIVGVEKLQDVTLRQDVSYTSSSVSSDVQVS